METVTISDELKALIGADGKVSEAVMLGEGCEFYGLKSEVELTVLVPLTTVSPVHSSEAQGTCDFGSAA